MEDLVYYWTSYDLTRYMIVLIICGYYTRFYNAVEVLRTPRYSADLLTCNYYRKSFPSLQPEVELAVQTSLLICRERLHLIQS